MKKFLTIIIVLAALAGAAYAAYVYWLKSQESTVAKYQTVAAQMGQLTSTIGATGAVRSNQSAVLSWQTSGTVEEVKAVVGDQVSVDDVLATLQRTSLSQNIIAAQADLISAQQAMDDLYINAETAKVAALQSIATYAEAVKDAQYQLDNYTIPTEQAGMTAIEALDAMGERLEAARQAFEPYKYFSSGDATRQDRKEDLDLAQSDYNSAVKRLEYEYRLEVAQANMDKARQDYEKYKAGPSQADIAAIQARIDGAQAAIKQTMISAPFDGTLTMVQVKPGDQAGPGKAAFQIDDLSHLLLDVSISEVDINNIKVGQDVSLSFDAIQDKEYHGVVSEVAEVGTPTQGVVEFIVTVELTDADEQVKPGMTAAVNVTIEELDNVLLAPNRAVRLRNGKRVVYILKGGQITPVEITLGASSDVYSQVLEGSELQTGDLIVLNPPLEFDQGGPPPFAR